MSPLSSPTQIRRLLFGAVPLFFGILAIGLGMDADWDLRNYHYYNAWAFLTDRYEQDIAVAQIPSFYNPIIDVPYFLLAQRLPARLLSFLLGSLHGLNFILLYCLSERLIRVRGPWKRFLLNSVIASAGVCGAVAVSEVGTVFYDNLLSLGLFGSLLLTLRNWTRLGALSWRQALGPAFLVGLPVGLAFGLKQTSVIYCVGICGGLLLSLPAPPWRRLFVAFFCGIGIIAGLAFGGGYWMWHLWHLYGNPLFPMFNQFFRSPWGLADSYRDMQYLNGGLIRRLFYPLIFSFDSRQASEIAFRDYRILAVFLLLPIVAMTALRRAWQKAPAWSHGIETRQSAFLFTATAISYLVWLVLFALYRYITALEMLAPLLVVLSLGYLSPLGRLRLPLAICLVSLLVVSSKPGNWIRVPFTESAITVTVPPIADAANTIVLLAGHEPLSYLLPAFPPELRFLRIDSTFTNPDQTDVRFNQVMRQRIENHAGRLLALFIPTERHDVVTRLKDYGLQLENGDCASVTSPIAPAPYALCPVQRR